MRDVRFTEKLSSRYLLAVAIAAAVVTLDLITKRAAAMLFVDERVTVIPGVLWFTYGENPGAAFSILQNSGPLFGVAAMIAVMVILFTLRLPRPGIEIVAFGMVMGGAAGNLVDRMARGNGVLDGHVIDWIMFPNFPIFNIADSSITIAVALLFLAGFRHREEAEA